MKKVLVVLSIALVIALSSCEKDRVCQCGRNSKVEFTETYHTTKMKAKQKCLALQRTLIETGCQLR